MSELKQMLQKSVSLSEEVPIKDRKQYKNEEIVASEFDLEHLQLEIDTSYEKDAGRYKDGPRSDQSIVEFFDNFELISGDWSLVTPLIKLSSDYLEEGEYILSNFANSRARDHDRGSFLKTYQSEAVPHRCVREEALHDHFLNEAEKLIDANDADPYLIITMFDYVLRNSGLADHDQLLNHEKLAQKATINFLPEDSPSRKIMEEFYPRQKDYSADQKIADLDAYTVLDESVMNVRNCYAYRAFHMPELFYHFINYDIRGRVHNGKQFDFSFQFQTEARNFRGELADALFKQAETYLDNDPNNIEDLFIAEALMHFGSVYGMWGKVNVNLPENHGQIYRKLVSAFSARGIEEINSGGDLFKAFYYYAQAKGYAKQGNIRDIPLKIS